MYQSKLDIELPAADTWLDVFVRIEKVEGREILPLSKEHLALIIIDIWDTGQTQCAFCNTIPKLLDIARAHDLVVIHAPSRYIDQDGNFINKPLLAPNIINPSWPPQNFLNKTHPFEQLNISRRQVEAGLKVVPSAIHGCARPVERSNEYVESTFEGVLEILERHKSLYLLYAGGAILECLVLKPAGYLNLFRAGYQPILIRDAVSGGPVPLDGNPVNMIPPGIVFFEQLCGFSTNLDALEKALACKESDNCTRR